MCHFTHNADFCQRRISKYPANAHKINYFSALCTECGRRGEYVLEFCDHTKFLRSCGGVSGKEMTEDVDYTGVSKYNVSW